MAQPSLEETRAVFEEQAAATSGQATVSIRLASEFHVPLADMAGSPLLTRIVHSDQDLGSILSQYARTVGGAT